MKVVLKILKGILTFFLLIVLFLVIFQKVTNNKMVIGNIYIFQVASASMEPVYKVGDVIVVKKVDANTLNVGDDVTYLGEKSNLNGLIITHRIIEKKEENGKQYFVTKGLANEIEDPAITADNIYGKVAYHTKLFSFVGRLMTNIIIYYALFVSVGVAFAYEIITAFFVKDIEEEIDAEGN